jgi:DNA-binding NarL/FixJ family response regulator
MREADNMGSLLKLVSSKIGIAIVEGDAVARGAMTRLLSGRPGLEVVASGSDIGTIAASQSDVDLFLISADQLDGAGVAASPALARALARGKVIMTDLTADHRHIVELIRLGVAGFVLRDALFTELVSTIRAVATGSHVLPPSLLASLIRDLARESGQHAAESMMTFNRMSQQQREIVMLVASGKRSGEIAAQQGITPDMAETQIRSIMTALHPHPLHIVTAAETDQERWTEARKRRPRPRPATTHARHHTSAPAQF